MRGVRLDRAVAGLAFAVALATSAWAGSDGPDGGAAASIDARVPVPQPADVRPPTRGDVEQVATPDLRQGVQGTLSMDAPIAAEPSPAVDQPAAAVGEADAKPGPGTEDHTGPADSSVQAAPAMPAPDADPAITGAVTERTPAGPAIEAPPATAAGPDGNTDAAKDVAHDGAGAAAKEPDADKAPARDSAGSAPTEAAKDAAGSPPTNATAVAPMETGKETAAAPPKNAIDAPPTDAARDAAATDAKESGKDAAGAGKDVKPVAANLGPADIAVAEKLRDLIGGKLDRIFERKVERTAVGAFYGDHGFAPLWIDNGAPNGRSKAVADRLRAADADGLNPTDYPIPDFAAASGRPDALAEAELRLTRAVLAYARHAQVGRIHFSRVSADIDFNLIAPEPAEVLGRMAQAKDVAEALGSYNPPQPGYQALRAKLAELRGHDGEAGPARIPPGPVIKLGMHDDRVPLLRERLGVAGDAGDNTYDKALANAVKTFQREHDLAATGNFTAGTLEALNGPRHEHVTDTIIANMERWRWLPRDLGNTYVMVNIPDYSLRVVHDGSVLWRTRVVVGKPSTPTPLLSEPMRYITINPTWNVPPSIVHNEYLPALQQDPNALARIGLRVEYNRDGSIHIFQPPGERNALGRIRFNFPNKFLVYQHDTPDKHLFGREKRAFSHGCMRVQDPVKYAEVLLSIGASKGGYTVERLQRMFGSEERDINLSPLIPVHVTYQTAFVDDAGKLEFRDDVYGRDSRLLAALKGDDRRIADVPVEHREHRRQVVRVPRQYPFPGAPDRDSGLSFFERLFR